MTIEQIIEALKKTYKDHDRLEEMLNDLSGESYYDYWGEALCDDEFDKNITLAKALFELYEKSDDYNLITHADAAANKDKLNDRELAKELYKKAILDCTEEGETDYHQLLRVGNSIGSSYGLEDKEWQREIIKEFEKNTDINDLDNLISLIHNVDNELQDTEWKNKLVSEAVDKFANGAWSEDIDYSASNLMQLAEHLEDEDAKNVFESIAQGTGITNLLDAGREALERFKGDSDWIGDFINTITEQAIDNLEEGYYCDVYSFLKNDLENDQTAAQFKNDFEDELFSDYQEYGGCEDLYDKGNDMDLDEVDFDDFEDTRMLVGIRGALFYDMEEMDDQDEKTEFASEKIEEFIEALSELLHGNIEENYFMAPKEPKYDGDSQYVGEVMAFDDALETVDMEATLFLVITKEIPQDTLNAIFLNMVDFGFYADVEDENGDFITQGYDFGEYDTGWFSHDEDEVYVNNAYTIDMMNKAKALFGINDDE